MAEPIELVLTARENTKQAFDKVEGRIAHLGERTRGFLELFGSVGGILATFGTARFFEEAIKKASDLQEQLHQISIIGQSLGRGISGQEFEHLADDLRKVSVESTGTILTVEKLISRFQNIGDETIPAATKAVLTLSKVMGGDATSAANLLGRALNNPDRAARTLQRSYVALTTAQITQIQTAAQSGRIAQAQALILAAIQRSLGDQLQIVTFSDRMKNATNAVEAFTERLGSIVTNSPTLNAALTVIADNFNSFLDDPERVRKLTEEFDRFFINFLKGSSATIQTIISLVSGIIGFTRAAAEGFTSLPPVLQKAGFLVGFLFGPEGVAAVAGISFLIERLTNTVKGFSALGDNELPLGVFEKVNGSQLEDILKTIDQIKAKGGDAAAIVAQITDIATKATKATGKNSRTQPFFDPDVFIAALKEAEERVQGPSQIAGAETGAAFGDGFMANLITQIGARSPETAAAFAKMIQEAAKTGLGVKPGGAGEGVFAEALRKQIASAQDKVTGLSLNLSAINAFPPSFARDLAAIDDEFASTVEHAETLNNVDLRNLAIQGAFLTSLTKRKLLEESLIRPLDIQLRQVHEQLDLLDISSDELRGFEQQRVQAAEAFAQAIEAAQGNPEAIAKTQELFTTTIALIAKTQADADNLVKFFNDTVVKSIGDFAGGLATFFVDFSSNTQDAIANFKEFSRSFVRDIAIMITRAIELLAIQTALKALGAGVGGTVGSFITQIAGQIHPAAKGGVVNSPTLLLAGEAGPEAIVPLNNSGLFGNNVSVTVNISQGGAQISSQGAAGQGRALGDLIAKNVKQTLLSEQRPGGLLHPTTLRGA